MLPMPTIHALNSGAMAGARHPEEASWWASDTAPKAHVEMLDGGRPHVSVVLGRLVSHLLKRRPSRPSYPGLVVWW